MSERNGILKSVCIFGLVIFIVLLGALLFLSHYGDVPLFSPSGFRSFFAALEDYDRRIAAEPDTSGPKRNALLDALEKKALDTENYLSVLKRRRAVPGGSEQYAASAERARKLYPYSGQIAVLAAESIIRLSSGQEKANVLDLVPLMAEGALGNLALAFSVYSGTMSDPATARRLPAELFSLLCAAASGKERERYVVNTALRTVLEEGPGEAVKTVNALFDEEPELDETWIFGAEFFYDHDDFLRSAEFFSRFTDDPSLARQADALWLAGFADSAAGLWRAASSGSGDTRPRSLYNLVSTVSEPAEKLRLLERLFSGDPAYEPGRLFGVLRYSRLAVNDRALAILDRTDKTEPLFDLELLRRRCENWTIDKTIAETWILLNNHGGDLRLAEWAAWYFDFQRRHAETALLLGNLERNGVKAPWMELHRAFAMIREGDFSGAEQTLRAAGGGVNRYGRYWQAAANLALILALDRKPEEALGLFEIAASIQANEVNRLREVLASQRGRHGFPPALREASRVQFYAARCLRTLNRETESRRTLDYALDLDPENMEAALEKRRIEVQGIL
jgi:tetratricopeptide (TPR) repeat protein